MDFMEFSYSSVLKAIFNNQLTNNHYDYNGCIQVCNSQTCANSR